MRCRLCKAREADPRRIIHADAYVPRYGERKRGIPVHVECWLAGGEDIAGLADDQLWHLPTAAWEHFGFFDGDDGAGCDASAAEPSTAPPDHGSAPSVILRRAQDARRDARHDLPVWGRALPSRVGRAPRARGTAGRVRIAA